MAAELRRLVLSEELLGTPALVRELTGQVQALAATSVELAEAQRRTESEIRGLAEAQQRTEATVRELVEGQQRTEARLDRIEQHTAELAEGQQRSEARLDRVEQHTAELVEGQQRLEGEVRGLGGRLDRVELHVGDLRGGDLERRYRNRAGAYFDDLVSRARPLSNQRLADLLDEGVAQGRLTLAERRDVLFADLVVSGRRREDGTDVYLVIEVSAVVDADDVAGAIRRSELLARLRPSVGLVAGPSSTPAAAARAAARGVWRVLDGPATAPVGRGG